VGQVYSDNDGAQSIISSPAHNSGRRLMESVTPVYWKLALPADLATLSAANKHLSRDLAILPADREILPRDKTILSINTKLMSGDKIASPAAMKILSRDRMILLLGTKPVSVNKEALPLDNEPLLTDKRAVSVSKTASDGGKVAKNHVFDIFLPFSVKRDILTR
jgi:hypothetical protein